LEELKERLKNIPAEKWEDYIIRSGYEVPAKYLEKLKEFAGQELPDKLLKKAMKRGGYQFPSKKLQNLKIKAGDKFPQHVGLIIDGNRRWAKKRRLDRNAGHYAGYKTLRKMVFEHYDLGIKYLSIYTLSLENIKKRDPEEIEYLYSLLIKIADELLNEKDQKNEKVKFNVFGRMTVLPPKVRERLEELVELTKENEEYFINFCIAYDGQEEIVDAVREILNDNAKLEQVTPEMIKNHLYTKGYPELDFVIRTGMGDGARISGFLLWDASYAEFKFRKEYWPDYNQKMLVKDLKDYLKRNRRRGK
jgi:undecaprenyl diphosphate synthase